ncbi:GntR family transcriptional regulator, partial [Streptomyces albogriseolus]|uniref:GntR family transcriptional regulator n=1 Tax=Streptomyces albogriseolus TaxID=1887 RepID=UPI0034600CFC
MRIPAHSVCTAIRDDIVAGVHERGGRLTEELLARRYGVSRVPVREALRTLEAEGFVVTRRHAGACVAEPTEQETYQSGGAIWSSGSHTGIDFHAASGTPVQSVGV